MTYEIAPSAELPALHEHPIYKEGIAQMASGQWQQALQSIQLLQGLYHDDAEIEELFDQVQMRATLTQFQPRQTSRTTKSLHPRWLMTGVFVAMFVAVAVYIAYEVWIGPVIVQEFRLSQITDLRTEADQAIVVGDYARARQSLQRLLALYPEDSETVEMLRRIELLERASVLYDESKALIGAGSWDQAIETLLELQSLDAEYRDLSQLLQTARESQALERQYQAAEQTFTHEDWASAITQYQALREANLTFRYDKIQERLFESHLRYGQTILQEAGTDVDRVSEAISYFSEALKTRPMDAKALDERRLAENYLAALYADNQDEVIDVLLMIYDEQPDYAGSQAAGLLYSLLLERATHYLDSGDKEAAIADYQVAAQLSVDDVSQAQTMLTELTAETAP
jgi:cell shape-determining protein MreC